MTVTLKHGFTSAIADDAAAAAAGEVLPSHWNANHSLSGGTDKSILFNQSGSIGEQSGLTWDSTGTTMAVPGDINATGDVYTGDATFLHRTTADLSNGAAALTGTLTNSPVTGNPTKWIAIDDNGTTRYMPTWHISASAYSGPGDVVAGAKVWWGLRAYTLASIGTNAIRLREDGGNTESDFATVSGGGLDLAAIATFKGANNLFVTKLYDQTGNGFDLVQATAGNQPTFTLSGLGSLPIISNTGTLSLASTSPDNTAQPLTVSYVAERTSAGALGTIVAAGDVLVGSDGANQVYMYAGSVQDATGNDNAWHAVQNVFNDTSSVLYIDGSSNATTPGAGATGNFAYEIFVDKFNQPYVGDFVEGGLWDVAFTPTEQSNMNSNQHTYWGF